jgi:hypothetical protein
VHFKHSPPIDVEFEAAEKLTRLGAIAAARVGGVAFAVWTPDGEPVDIADAAEPHGGGALWVTRARDFLFTDETETAFRVRLRAVRDALQDLAFCEMSVPGLNRDRCREFGSEIDRTLRGVLCEYAADFGRRRRAILAFRGRATAFVPTNAKELRGKFGLEFRESAERLLQNPDPRLQELSEGVRAADVAAVIRVGRIPGIDEGAAEELLKCAIAYAGLTKLAESTEALDAFLEEAEGDFVIPFERAKIERLDKPIARVDVELEGVARAIEIARENKKKREAELMRICPRSDLAIDADDRDPLWMHGE